MIKISNDPLLNELEMLLRKAHANLSLAEKKAYYFKKRVRPEDIRKSTNVRMSGLTLFLTLFLLTLFLTLFSNVRPDPFFDPLLTLFDPLSFRRFYRGAAEIAEQAQRDFDRRKNSLRLLSDLCGSAVIMTISTYSESQAPILNLHQK